LADDLHQNLGKIDRFEQELLARIDAFIEKSGMDAPPEVLPVLRDGYDAKMITEMDLRPAGVKSVIWATGFGYDYSLVKLPIFDEFGYPVQKRGLTAYPGLYFVGLAWLYKHKSGLLFGVGEDAEYIAKDIGEKSSIIFPWTSSP